MLPYRDSRLTRIAIGALFLIVIVYAYYEARGLLFGPSITIAAQTAVVTDPYIVIQGKADHIASLSVDGGQIEVTETGAFQEAYVLAPGLNRIVFDAKDKYGHTTEKVVQIVYAPSAASITEISTSTVATSTSELSATSTSSTTDPVAPEQ